MVHTCNPSARRVGTGGGLEHPGYPQLHGKCEASLGYIKPCPKEILVMHAPSPPPTTTLSTPFFLPCAQKCPKGQNPMKRHTSSQPPLMQEGSFCKWYGLLPHRGPLSYTLSVLPWERVYVRFVFNEAHTQKGSEETCL